MTLNRASTFTVSLGFLVLAALGVLLLWFWWTPPNALPKASAEQLAAAPQGSLFIEGWLQLEHEQRYTRSVSVLGRRQSEVLRVVPLTREGWQPTEEVVALAILRSDAPSRFFQGPAVKLGPLDPAWEATFPVSKEAALIELVPGEAPGWWLALGGFALLVFLVIAARGVIKRARS
jgi:hypothetical protein